jgi:IS5 family transposase
MGILNAKSTEHRKPLYRDLVLVAGETVQSAERILKVIDLAVERSISPSNVSDLVVIRNDLARFTPLTQRVIRQTERRVFENEKVPSSEKLVSIFEEHTDIIVKDRRETLYGHKICLTTGRSSLVTDCIVLDGNPTDSTLAEMAIDRQIEITGRVPRQAAFDGGFTSRANLTALKGKGVEDVAFSKARALNVTDMVRNSSVYKKLRNFRAGIEGTISFLKRVFGLDRCTWRSLPSFKSYVWSSIVTFNLLVIARHELA